jgi:hypothetical protein
MALSAMTTIPQHHFGPIETPFVQSALWHRADSGPFFVLYRGASHKPVTAIIAPVNGVGALRQAQSKKEKGGLTIAAMLPADVTKVT